MNEQVTRSTAGYSENAEILAEQYERLTFYEVLRDVLPLFPVRPSRVLDIGAGTGRDAAALAARGHTVTAVEPTRELRERGQQLHPSPAIRWVDDILPHLTRLSSGQGCFDLILLTAVWMHLDADERRMAIERITGLVASLGLVVISLRHGPVPSGRRMFDVSADETMALAAEHGLITIHCNEREDMLGRSDVWWTFLVFQAA